MMRKLIILASLLVMTASIQNLSLAAPQTTLTLYPIADNYVDSKYPGSSQDLLGRYGKTTVLYVGNSYDHAQDIWGSERIYIRFDLTKLGKNRIIINATLSLWQFYAPRTNQTYEAYRVLNDWNETTQNWNSQPACSSTKTSEAIAPNWAQIAVVWDLTDDVRVWYGGHVPNHGTMIKAAKEEHAIDASSGFWSREYPVGPHEEWKPKLIITLEGDPTMTYTVAVSVSGLPSQAVVPISVDAEPFGSLSPGKQNVIIFDRGTTHTIAVTGLVPGSAGVRYRCGTNETQVTAATSHVFDYWREYWVSFSVEPDNMFQTPPNGWYPENSTLQVMRIGPDVLNTSPGTRLVFGGWLLNKEEDQTDLRTIIVNEPITIAAGYKTEYYLNVTSPIARTSGSGWWAKDALASYSVDPQAVPSQGVLGLLGLKHSFIQWVGYGSSIDFPSEPSGTVIMREPTTLVAVWQDDWKPLAANITLLLLAFAAALAAVILRTRRHRPSVP